MIIQSMVHIYNPTYTLRIVTSGFLLIFPTTIYYFSDPDSDPESESSSVKAVIICGVTVGVGVPGMCVTVWCIIVCCMQRKNECQVSVHMQEII